MQTTLECGHVPSEHSEMTTGYGVDAEGNRHCYACCAELDRANMLGTGRATLYLTTKAESASYGSAKVTNWPGSLEFSGRYSVGRHNIARKRYDVVFIGPDGAIWTGTQYGDNTQICHCRRTKYKRLYSFVART